MSSCYADSADALRLISGVLNDNHRYADGFRLAKQGLSINPEPFSALQRSKGVMDVGQARECFPYAMQASRFWPENEVASVQYFVSCVQLVLGNFDEGWKQHNIFYTYPSISRQLVHPDPEWNGESVAGCRFFTYFTGDSATRYSSSGSPSGCTDKARRSMYSSMHRSPELRGMTGVRAVYTYPTVPGGPCEYWSI